MSNKVITDDHQYSLKLGSFFEINDQPATIVFNIKLSLIDDKKIQTLNEDITDYFVMDQPATNSVVDQ